MAKKNEDATFILNSKSALPNKLLQQDGTITDITGKQVVNPVDSYDAKPALPNKFLNPDGTYSTLNEIIASMVDTSLFIIVNELPATGDEQKIYLLSDGKGGFIEYHWTGDKWDPIGTVEIDLSDYSTTQEMMNAIEAAALSTLNSAKAYTDEQIAGLQINPQVFYWNGSTNQAGIDFWNKVMLINDTTDVLVIKRGASWMELHQSDLIKAPKGKIRRDKATDRYDWVSYSEESSLTDGYSKYMFQNSYIGFTIENDIITKISILTTPVNHMNFLITDYNYHSPYVPQYPGSPATKKYVDDSIATNITNVLGGSY